jgi:nicotinamidase-related amidase
MIDQGVELRGYKLYKKNVMEDSQSDYITVINSVLLLVDYQSDMIRNIESGDRAEIRNAAIAAAKAASILNVPVIMTSSDNESNGDFIQELSDIFPRQDVIVRKKGQLNAFEDERVLKAIRKYGREKLIISGLLTSESFSETAIHAVNEGYDVFGLIDACGDTSHERHNYGVHRMLKAGITPITWMSLASEWMNGWVDPTGGELSDEIFGKYNAMLNYLSRH